MLGRLDGSDALNWPFSLSHGNETQIVPLRTQNRTVLPELGRQLEDQIMDLRKKWKVSLRSRKTLPAAETPSDRPGEVTRLCDIPAYIRRRSSIPELERFRRL